MSNLLIVQSLVCINECIVFILAMYLTEEVNGIVHISNWTKVVRSNTTKDLPNTHRRSTAETAMNPIGQTFPVIHIHLVGNFEQPPQLLNVGTFETSSDIRSDHLLFFSETNIQIPTVNNASHIVAEIFHDYGMHHLTCEFKTLKKKLFIPTDSVYVASISQMTSTIVFRIRC